MYIQINNFKLSVDELLPLKGQVVNFWVGNKLYPTIGGKG